MMMITSALDLGHQQLPTPQDLPAAERQGGRMLPHMDPGRLLGTPGIALGRCTPTAPVTSALKNSSFSNMLQVPGRYTAASRVSGTSTFLPRRVSFSHSLV